MLKMKYLILAAGCFLLLGCTIQLTELDKMVECRFSTIQCEAESMTVISERMTFEMHNKERVNVEPGNYTLIRDGSARSIDLVCGTKYIMK